MVQRKSTYFDRQLTNIFKMYQQQKFSVSTLADSLRNFQTIYYNYPYITVESKDPTQSATLPWLMQIANLTVEYLLFAGQMPLIVFQY